MAVKLDLSRLRLAAAEGAILAVAKAEVMATARDVEQTSRDRAPELTGELVDSHGTQTSSPVSSGYFIVTVSAGPVYGPAGEDYAVLMHEGLPGRPKYDLGTDSRIKNDGRTPHTGDGVGRKFLERALLDRGAALARRIAAAIRRISP